MDYTVRIVILGACLLGAIAGALGSLAVLRKQSLLGDSISHAALPGIVLAFMVFSSKAPLILLLGASLAGVIGTWLIMHIIRTTKIQTDAAQGVVLSVFFGLGLLLLSSLKTSGDAHQAGLEKFIFGQAAALLPEDLYLMIGFGLTSFIVLILFWKPIKSMTFDLAFSQSMGYSRSVTDLIITSLLVSAIVIGLQTVGVILMSAMVVAPAAAARQWTRSKRRRLFSALHRRRKSAARTGTASGKPGQGQSTSTAPRPVPGSRVRDFAARRGAAQRRSSTGPHRASPRRRLHHCSPLMISSRTKEMTSITTASAVAPA